jgi:hypothetical protein
MDASGRQAGRGTYLCPQAACWDKALRSGSLARLLKVTISEADLRELRRIAEAEAWQLAGSAPRVQSR